MKAIAQPSFLRGVFGNRCPSCGEGAVFSGLYQMNETCPACQYRFEREDGYFLGAMVISYFVGGFSAVPTLIYFIFGAGWEPLQATLLSCVQIVLGNPPLFHFSRLAWLHMDREVSRRAFEQDQAGNRVDDRKGSKNHS